MKLGMYDSVGQPVLDAFQVAALRILSAGVVLIPFSINAFRRIPASSWGYVILSGLLGSFLPAFLFCIAETRIDSALTAMLNTLTPIFALLTSAIVYRKVIPSGQVLGVIAGFAGCILLFLSKRSAPSGELLYAVYVIIATICYGLNVNMVRQRLAHVSSMDIATGAFAAFIVPSLLVLFFTGYHKLPLFDSVFIKATAAAVTLGILGTAFASVIFYMLVKMAGIVFSSLVTYGIPFIAILWGLLYGEQVTLMQVGALLVVLSGVYIASSGINYQSIKNWKRRAEPVEEMP
jgi:drug/metabolite transporter (DMT)-like permease